MWSLITNMVRNGHQSSPQKKEVYLPKNKTKETQVICMTSKSSKIIWRWTLTNSTCKSITPNKTAKLVHVWSNRYKTVIFKHIKITWTHVQAMITNLPISRQNHFLIWRMLHVTNLMKLETTRSKSSSKCFHLKQLQESSHCTRKTCHSSTKDKIKQENPKYQSSTHSRNWMYQIVYLNSPLMHSDANRLKCPFLKIFRLERCRTTINNSEHWSNRNLKNLL